MTTLPPVRDPKTGELVPWSLEWQVDDDMAFLLRREVERLLPDPTDDESP